MGYRHRSVAVMFFLMQRQGRINVKGGFGMSAVFGAFMQYLVTAVYYIAIAGLGIFAGKKLLQRKKGRTES